MIRNDRTIRALLAVIAALLAANLLVTMNTGGARTAMAAGIPDSGAQAQAVVDQLLDLNKKVDRLDSFLESGNLQIKTKETKTDK